MSTHEIQLAFWTALRDSNPELFGGLPSGTHFFDIPMGDGFIIRLDIYLKPRDYRTKGTQTISFVLDNKKMSSVKSKFNGSKDFILLYDKGLFFQASNGQAHSPITEHPDSWDCYINWFSKYTKKLKDLVSTWILNNQEQLF